MVLLKEDKFLLVLFSGYSNRKEKSMLHFLEPKERGNGAGRDNMQKIEKEKKRRCKEMKERKDEGKTKERKDVGNKI